MFENFKYNGIVFNEEKYELCTDNYIGIVKGNTIAEVIEESEIVFNGTFVEIWNNELGKCVRVVELNKVEQS